MRFYIVAGENMGAGKSNEIAAGNEIAIGAGKSNEIAAGNLFFPYRCG